MSAVHHMADISGQFLWKKKNSRKFECYFLKGHVANDHIYNCQSNHQVLF